jgi:16S rRNA (cytosine1402-N4)-methyltransferase
MMPDDPTTPRGNGDPPRDPSPRPKRRPRYRGTHPRRFDERYKELAPEQYPDEIAKVRARGQTPAGAHVPVMLDEVLAALDPKPGEVALDCTLGHGGHTRAIAERVGPGGLVISLDWDPEELDRTARDLSSSGLSIRARRANFAGAAEALRAEAVEAVDVVLADLGMSSMQVDRPERGFSLKHDGPLDMRMDRTRGHTLGEWLSTVTEAELSAVIDRYGDEPDAARIAAAIVARRGAGRGLRRTAELVDVILRAKRIDPHAFRRETALRAHPAARTFQALRVVVNRELENLAQLLRSLPWIVRPGGRVALIAFHVGEDRLIAAALEEGRTAGWWSATATEPVTPGYDEVHRNPRARSAKLRWAVRA